jgi:hypothetical protein
MTVYYHIDRLGTLTPGNIINLVRYDDVRPEYLQQHVDMLFPEGLSSHGETYFLKNQTPASGVNPVIELLFEYVRQSHYANIQSRFQSLFAFGSIEDARIFRERFCNNQGFICRVECEETQAFKADMNILTLRDSLLVLSYRAHCYWQGLPDPSGAPPLWEYLLKPPVQIVSRL